MQNYPPFLRIAICLSITTLSKILPLLMYNIKIEVSFFRIPSVRELLYALPAA